MSTIEFDCHFIRSWETCKLQRGVRYEEISLYSNFFLVFSQNSFLKIITFNVFIVNFLPSPYFKSITPFKYFIDGKST